MLRSLILFILPLGLAACASNRVEVIPQEEAYLAFADIKEQLLDYQSHMDWLASHPDEDDILKNKQGKAIYCGRPGGIRLDITSATANLALETISGSALNATGTGTGGAITSGLGGSRTGSMSYNYAVEIGENLSPQKGGTTPLAQTLLTLRNNFIESQYALQDRRGCLNWVPGDNNFATLKLVKANQKSVGAFFAIGPLVINPGVSDSRSLTNTLTVKFALSPQLTDSGAPAARAGLPAAKGAGNGGSGPGDIVIFGNGSINEITQEGAINMPMGITIMPAPAFPFQ